MKKVILFTSIIIAIGIIYSAWNILGPVVNQPEKRFLYINTGSSFENVKSKLKSEHILSNTFFFELISKRIGYNKHVKPGKYEIKKGENLFSLLRMLNSGSQTPVRLVINKLRTKEDLAEKIGKNFECDSAEAIRFLLNNDSLATFGLDTNTVMTAIIPNSYLFWWNIDMKKILTRLKKQHDLFWKGERIKKASLKNFTAVEVYTIASIVEEETNRQSDKGLIASVYINRLSKNMRLEADPTVKYALRNFELKRIMHDHLDYPSPYNTYRNTGLPPGPICTPSINTIEAVLDAPKTNYLFFVAKPDFNGYSNFAETYSQHLVNAKKYQIALDSLLLKKQELKLNLDKN